MAQTLPEWLESQADRGFARQRAQVDTAKLVGTFAAGIAATLVATALQVGPPSQLDKLSTYLLALAVLGAICVIQFDRLGAANHKSVIEDCLMLGMNEQEIIRELRKATVAAVKSNLSTVKVVRYTLLIQVLISMATGGLATVSLLSATLPGKV